ncbi:MAG: 4Fe-4S dicluster domain-containing protein [bacterium]|nr:4Fe-4S dicluster domain-containing protein [bacterium]
MKEVVIISGKGGTGKTSLTASFAALADNAVVADCDVDAADLHLVLNPQLSEGSEFRSGFAAQIREHACIACGMCASLCRFDAVLENGRATVLGRYRIDTDICEGCGVCAHFCPESAIDLHERICGEWWQAETEYGPLVHARLGVGAENSGKLVSLVRLEARRIAEERNRSLILVDGPPGIGCPVIASVTGASLVVIVTEPTLAGEHDLERILALAEHFSIPAVVCVNKWDINPEITERIEKRTLAVGARPIGRIPYDRIVTEAQVNGQPVVTYSSGPVAERIEGIWLEVLTSI